MRVRGSKYARNAFAAPNPAGGAYRLQRSPDPLAGFKGPTSKGRGVEGRRDEREGEEREGAGRGN